MTMKRIMITLGAVAMIAMAACNSNTTDNDAMNDSMDMAMPDTSMGLMGADTTSAASDSLMESLNR